MRRCAPLVLAIGLLAACTTPGTPAAESAPALFYAKSGAIYVSDPAGTPGRKLTDGPHDTEPAPSPDGTKIAYVRKDDPAQPGGELWVLEISSGDTRRLVDAAALKPAFDGDLLQFSSPRWSPTGERIAFLRSTYGGGGALLTADAGTGAVMAPPSPLFADWDFAWAPDGRHIAWVEGRSDVRAVDVGIYTVGGSSTPVATGTNAFSVSYAADGSVLFANGNVDESMFSGEPPFTLRQGGIYAVQPPGKPRPLLTGAAWYSDVAGLASGGIGFTEASADASTKTIKVLGRDGGSPEAVARTVGPAPNPAWAGDTVAYIGSGPDTDGETLLIKKADGKTQQDPRQVDVGVDSFAWGG